MMLLKNGKFYKDNVEVPIEIGNKEQIALIKEYEKNLVNGVKLNFHINETTHYDLSCLWKCPNCQKSNHIEYNFEEDEPTDNDIESVLEDENYRCYNCRTKFEFKVETIDRDKIYKITLPNENEED
jgi:hypothetical protein